MGCIYEDRNDYICTLWEKGHNGSPVGCDMETGVCNVSDDPDPSDNCDSYESDWTCFECGADLNVEDCGCADEE